MGFLTQGLLFLFRHLLKRHAVKEMQRKGVLYYLKTLQVLRKSLIGTLVLFFIFQLMVLGFIGALVVGVLLWPEALEVKLWILLGVFSTLFLFPFIALIIIFSERLWYKYSGADQMLKNENTAPIN